MEFLAEYGLFLAKTATLVAAVVVVILVGAAASRRGAAADTLETENLNDKYRKLANTLQRSVLPKAALKAFVKRTKREAKARMKSGERRPRTFVIDFKGDIKATGADSLREEVSAVLSVAGDGDEVLVRLDNAGGMVHEHGLAAAQLARLREQEVPLTVAVDKVAASGGYLMACVAERIVAAPFAVIGSIGVIAQLPNFNRFLDSHGVDFEQITAGKYKRTVTMFGKNTDEDRAKLREELEDVHALFKSAVSRYRPGLDLEQVATGEHWYGRRALELKLIDEITTSDELIAAAVRERDVYRVNYKRKKPIAKKLVASVESLAESLSAAGWRRPV